MRLILIFADWPKDKVYRFNALCPLCLWQSIQVVWTHVLGECTLYSVHNPGIMKEFHENLISLVFEMGQPNQAICLITFSVVKITSQAYSYNWQKIDVTFENKSQFIKVSESKVALEYWLPYAHGMRTTQVKVIEGKVLIEVLHICNKMLLRRK